MPAEPPSQRAPWAPLRTPLPGPVAGLRAMIRVHLRAAPWARRSFDNVVAALRADHKSPPFEWPEPALRAAPPIPCCPAAPAAELTSNGLLSQQSSASRQSSPMGADLPTRISLALALERSLPPGVPPLPSSAPYPRAPAAGCPASPRQARRGRPGRLPSIAHILRILRAFAGSVPVRRLASACRAGQGRN